MSTDLLVPLRLPAGPHVLVDKAWIATLDEVESRIANLVITDAVSYQAAGDLQIRITRAGKALEDARQAVKAPFIQAGRDIDAAASKPAIRITTALNLVKRLIADFAEVQRKAAAKAEADRLAELARLEVIAKAEREEAQRKADDLARQAREAQAEKDRQAAALATANQVAPEELEFAEEPPPPPEPPQKTATELEIERVKFAPVAVVAKPQGLSYRCTLRIKSVDVKLLPEVFVIRTPDEAAIRKLYCVGWKDGQPVPECPGCVFEVDRTPVDTGRTKF